MTADRFFRIPGRTRRRMRLSLGVRVLLIGHRTHDHLLLYPPASLDVLCAAALRLSRRPDSDRVEPAHGIGGHSRRR
ncbi:hypothetical protein CJ469_04473 [Nocardia farcinica]|uniref:hypothetical protein n=1 Tax=Nocardia farcinica TaxID=37329 RepID=UPI000BF32195|nr:hypothetical protein [Nocardia farcinica]PFX00290.1 hypothetical protein CJ469_04473 [Nocardia farcinica]PFX07838.1 hypothetical protein CJ468_03230 [Nocardia farcinica]